MRMIIVTRLLILCCLTLSYWGFGGIPGISPAIHAKVLALTVERSTALELPWGITDAPMAALSSPYGYRDRPSSDGIGKTYMGREIAQVMGYPGAAWLERPSRMQSEKPHLLIANLDIKARDVIADIGAGTGYLSVRLAAQVPDGQVLAVDVQPEMIALLRQRIEAQQLDNIEPILALDGDPQLPEGSIDMAIMVDVYHELAYPYEVMRKVVRALRPGGKVVLVEYRGENPLIPIKRLHKMTERQVRREMAAVGLTWVTTNEDLPKQHIIVFTKKDSVAG